MAGPLLKPITHGERRGTLYAFAYVIIVNYIIALWFLSRYLFEKHVVPRIIGREKFKQMDEGNRRTMTNHFVNIFWKLSAFCGLYPYIMTVIFNKSDRTYMAYTRITYGDLLALDYMLFTAGFLFEIIYRSRISLVTALHHIVALFLSTLIAAMIVNDPRNQEAQAELKLIFTYGFFEVIFETGPHVLMLLYKRSRDNTAMLARGFRIVAFMSFTGTFLEQFAIGYLFIHHWHVWDLSLKILSPILHVCFACAQIHSGRIFLALSRKMAREEKAKRDRRNDPELAAADALAAAGAGKDGKNGGQTFALSEYSSTLETVPSTVLGQPIYSAASASPPPTTASGKGGKAGTGGGEAEITVVERTGTRDSDSDDAASDNAQRQHASSGGAGVLHLPTNNGGESRRGSEVAKGPWLKKAKHYFSRGPNV